MPIANLTSTPMAALLPTSTPTTPTSTPLAPLASVDELMTLLAAGVASEEDGSEHDATDYPVLAAPALALVAHALQCGEILRERFPDDVELQVAGLIHDIAHHRAHAVSGRSEDHELAHGRQARELVEPLLGTRVARIAELHVPAKRFLVTVDTQYRTRLSRTSKETLVRQGRLMSPSQVDAFLKQPDADVAVELRRADDEAKVPGRTTLPLEWWQPVLHSLGGR